MDPKVARPCCSWVGRGVGLGDGKVFVGQLDAKLVALDQGTGCVWNGGPWMWPTARTALVDKTPGASAMCASDACPGDACVSALRVH